MLKPSTTWVHQCTPQYPKYRNLQFAIVWVKVGQSFQESSNNSLWSSPNPSRSLYMFFQLYPCFNPNKYLQFQFKQVPVPAKKPSKPKNNPETHICPALQQILHHLLLTWWRGVWGEHGRVNNRKMTGFMVGKMTYDNVSWGTSWFTIDFAVFLLPGSSEKAFCRCSWYMYPEFGQDQRWLSNLICWFSAKLVIAPIVSLAQWLLFFVALSNHMVPQNLAPYRVFPHYLISSNSGTVYPMSIKIGDVISVIVAF